MTIGASDDGITINDTVGIQARNACEQLSIEANMLTESDPVVPVSGEDVDRARPPARS